MNEIIKVGMSDVRVCSAPGVLITLGLGSCVGIAIRDPYKKIGGLLHAMLPDSTKIAENDNINKFVDTGIDELVRLLVASGADHNHLVAKVAGGAQMFKFANLTNYARVGDRNIESTTAKLSKLKIPIIAQDVGSVYGRTVTFHPEDGSYVISTVGKGISVI